MQTGNTENGSTMRVESSYDKFGKIEMHIKRKTKLHMLHLIKSNAMILRKVRNHVLDLVFC